MYSTLFRRVDVDEALKRSIIIQNGTDLQIARANVVNPQINCESQEQSEPQTTYLANLPYKLYVPMFCVYS